MTQWGYTKSNGPHTWANNVEAARGKHQSPVDIIPEAAKYDHILVERPLSICYTASNAQKLLNHGRSVQVVYEGAGSAVQGGPLGHKYQIVQFHFHWGSTSQTGSEHTVNGKQYAGEIHLVHYNSDKYSKFADAVTEKDGVCVLGIFIKPGTAHAGLRKLTDLFNKISHKGDSVDLDSYDPACLLPGNRSSYWTYPGSLTTPPCYESVTWVVFKEPIEVSEDQLKQFRGLVSFGSGESTPSDEFQGHLVENYRPPLPLNDRTVRASFQL